MSTYTPAFETAFALTFAAEVGTTKDGAVVDTGGRTIMGISEKSWPHDYANISSILEHENRVLYAKGFYHQEFWKALSLDRLESPEIAYEIFDTAVNTGPGTAAEIAQQAVNAMHGFAYVKVDGELGPMTRAAINGLTRRYEANLMGCLNLFQGIYYWNLAQKDDKYQDQFKGWMKRTLVPPEIWKGLSG